jgi:hypothetical protein
MLRLDVLGFGVGVEDSKDMVRGRAAMPPVLRYAIDGGRGFFMTSRFRAIPASMVVMAFVLMVATACGDDADDKKTATPSASASAETATATTPATRTASPTAVATTAVATTSSATQMTPSATVTAVPSASPVVYLTPPAVTTKAAAGSGIVTLRDVRIGKNDGYDRIVFEFDGAQLPGYEVKWVQAATQCASGMPVTTQGAAQLQVTLRSTQAHDAQGKSTIASLDMQPGYPAIKEARSSCDFEGVVSWVVGTITSGYRVTELQNPTRLVVDVQQ